MLLRLFFSNLYRSFRSLSHSRKAKPVAQFPHTRGVGLCPICNEPEALRWRDYVLELYDNCRFLNHYIAVEDLPFIPCAEQDPSRSSSTPQAVQFSPFIRRPSPIPQVIPDARPGEPQFFIQLPSLIEYAIRFHRPLPAHLRAVNLAGSRITRRSLTTTTTQAPTPISPSTYHALADEYIDALVLELEELQEDREEVDCEYSAGVLTLAFPPNGTYVLNKQPPNKQIWLSSPLSGPKRYDYVAADDGEKDGDGKGTAEGEERGRWVYLRDGSTLTGLLRRELGVFLAGKE